MSMTMPVPMQTLPTDTEQQLVDDAVELARTLLRQSVQTATRRERRRQQRMGRLLADPAARELVFGLTDEVLRIDEPRRAAQRFAAVVTTHPTSALGIVDRMLLRAGALVAPRIPRLVMPLVTTRIKAETRGIVLPADDPAFARHLRERNAEGVRLNVNPLGEAILSDAEADERMRLVCERIDRPDVDYVSVKISALVANLDALAFEHSLERVCDRLVTLYRRAQAAAPVTFVNLDMEEYRDLELTMQGFMHVLSMPEFRTVDAGIVLQAYLPDSHEALERLGEWAAQRRAGGGGRVKVRLVKGANLAMERVEAELHGWVAAPYATKADVDASYKALLDGALRPEWADALRIGVASHNLFDVAWALLSARRAGAIDRTEIEMLEGMAPAQARAVLGEAGELLMYAPVVADRDFDASIAYLSRRLDENTQPDNFLRALFQLAPDSAAFEQQAELFRRSVAGRYDVAIARRRQPIPVVADRFVNEPDGDATDAEYRAALATAMASPPRPPVTRSETVQQIDAVVAGAARPDNDDRAMRRAWLLAAADRMAEQRVQTVALMATEVGKTAREGDPEVSEAVDFCRYYATVGIDRLDAVAGRGLTVAPRGLVVVVGPWNFPYAIPVGGVAAALAAGNSVVLKPAPEAVAVGAWIAEQFWSAGVPRNVLQLVVCPDNEVGRRLVTHPDVDTVVLTGSYDTAALFLDWKPDLRLFAETSGKNALVITASADIDLAIADLVRSAFGHAGQKCSAASLGIVEASVYDDPSFRQRLADAVRSLRVLPADHPASMVGPVIMSPAGNLRRALTTLDPGERWLVEPQMLAGDDRLWSPGVRLDVQAGSWFHTTECFGPVLGLMRADDLDHAIELQNGTAYGLTGGIHSLDDAEVECWLTRVQVGNAYINRHITGAIVQRQPFGGWKRSSVGAGSKAGGPDYVAQFAHITQTTSRDARQTFSSAWAARYNAEHDPTGLGAESNVLRYVPVTAVAVRHDGGRDDALELLRTAARITGVQLVESDARVESPDQFVARLAGVERLRLLTACDDDTRRAVHLLGVAIVDDAPVTDGEVELRHWVREQAVSRTRHRHGRVVSSRRAPA
jgi:RHH-type transcriptional regulator, proline utilization regulon repressor / proline dehydrogenase / delta 1-pyrroline-5-carboxylate dehydrogenase